MADITSIIGAIDSADISIWVKRLGVSVIPWINQMNTPTLNKY